MSDIENLEKLQFKFIVKNLLQQLTYYIGILTIFQDSLLLLTKTILVSVCL